MLAKSVTVAVPHARVVGHFSVIVQSDSQMTASPFGNGKECQKSKRNTLITDYHVIQYVLNVFGID